MQIEARLAQMGLVLPEALKTPPGLNIPFAWVRVSGTHAYISGHGALRPDGSLAGPFGRVGAEVSPEDAYASARAATLAMLGSLKRELGDLDRIHAWLVVRGMVQVAPGFTETTNVINGCSDVLLQLFGDEGRHARSAIGVAALTQNLPVILEAEVEIEPQRFMPL